jgi:hypothetical protein
MRDVVAVCGRRALVGAVLAVTLAGPRAVPAAPFPASRRLAPSPSQPLTTPGAEAAARFDADFADALHPLCERHVAVERVVTSRHPEGRMVARITGTDVGPSGIGPFVARAASARLWPERHRPVCGPSGIGPFVARAASARLCGSDVTRRACGARAGCASGGCGRASTRPARASTRAMASTSAAGTRTIPTPPPRGRASGGMAATNGWCSAGRRAGSRPFMRPLLPSRANEHDTEAKRRRGLRLHVRRARRAPPQAARRILFPLESHQYLFPLSVPADAELVEVVPSF